MTVTLIVNGCYFSLEEETPQDRLKRRLFKIMKGNFSVLSPCNNYVASTLFATFSLEIHTFAESLELHRKYDLVEIIRNQLSDTGLGSKRQRITPIVSQVVWEHVIKGSQATKVALVIDNFAIVLVFDIREESIPPIIVQQSRRDGISKIQWIPPAIQEIENTSGESTVEKTTGGYVNSKQFIVFAKHSLYLKLYSVDCTHIVFTIVKPLLDYVLIRPNKSNVVWSVIASSIEFNGSSVIYHFYNEGSTSTLLTSYRLPSRILTDPLIEWSNSGNWLSIMNDDEELFGFDLKIFNLLGCIKNDNPKEIEPLISLQFLTEGIVDNDGTTTSLVEVCSTKYTSKWLSYDNSEYLLVVNITEARDIQFILVSVGLLRIVSKQTRRGSSIFSGWKQVTDSSSVKYRHILNKTYQWSSDTLKEIRIINSNIILRSDDTCLIFELTVKTGSGFQFEFKSAFQVSSKIISLSTKNEKLEVVAIDHVAEYDFEAGSIVVLYTNSKEKIKQAYFADNKIVVMHESINNEELSIRNWEKIDSTESNKENHQEQTIRNRHSDSTSEIKWSELNQRVKRNRFDSNRFSLLGSTSLIADEITDTFDMRKRAKVDHIV
ncbi:uncharacterized protein RJT20DRAFT_138953 [Scheffersomyces xylosifermentans]|uniref:uncharacterized protein n=1 Tax=Scheffersomyces xylosifermentans TaxID=1304137 RepID=UPI00315D977A